MPVDTAPEMTEPLGPMYLVRIDDVAPQSFDCYHCGADIDAVMVVTASGDVVYPTDLVALEFRNAPITGWDICWRSILDPPDAFPDYPDTSRCVLEDELYGCLPFIPLGGDGAFVIYEMEVPISPGDTVVVLEVGGCELDSGEALLDPFEVSIGTRPAAPYEWGSSTWVYIGEGTGPEARFEVPAL